MIVAHNHPSGELQPSVENRQATTVLVSCGALLGIPLLDHVIVGAGGYFSFCDSGLLGRLEASA